MGTTFSLLIFLLLYFLGFLYRINGQVISNNIYSDASTTLNTTTPADSLVSKSELSKMNIKQVGQRLRSQGVAEGTIETFQQFNVSGNMIVDGLNETEIMEMGFKSSIQVRGIKNMLLQLTSEGTIHMSTTICSFEISIIISMVVL
jgi:hypothetical protein